MRMKLGTLKRIIREAVEASTKKIVLEPGSYEVRQLANLAHIPLRPDEMPTHVMLRGDTPGHETEIPSGLRNDTEFLRALALGNKDRMKELIDKHNSSRERDAKSALDFRNREMARPRDIRGKIAMIMRDVTGYSVIPGMPEGELKTLSLSMVEKLKNHLDYILNVQTLVPDIGSLTGQALEAAVEVLKDDVQVQEMAAELDKYHDKFRELDV